MSSIFRTPLIQTSPSTFRVPSSSGITLPLEDSTDISSPSSCPISSATVGGDDSPLQSETIPQTFLIFAEDYQCTPCSELVLRRGSRGCSSRPRQSLSRDPL